jgi:dipeptidyl-peptidase-4
MKRIFVSALFVMAVHLGFSQLKQLTMEEAMLKARTTLAPANLKQLQFIQGTNEYTYLKKMDGKEVWVKGSMKSKTEEQSWFGLTDLNNYLKKAGIDTMTNMPAIQFFNTHFITTVGGQKIKGNFSDQTTMILLDKKLASKEYVERSESGLISYVENNNLYLFDGKTDRAITTDGHAGLVYGTTVHQSEFGITKGTFWSNDGKKLAYYRMDQHMIPDYPIVDWSSRPARNEPLKYPMAGDSSHHVTLWVYDATTQKNIQIQTSGDPEQFLTNVAWSPDDRYIYIAILNRAQNHYWLNQYDAVNGSFVKTLFDESDPQYVEPLVPMLFVKNNPQQFIWQSRRSGWNHLYLYDMEGKLIRQLTSGNWDVIEVKGFDVAGANLHYVSTEVSPVSKNLYRVNLKTAKSTTLTSGNMVHQTLISADGTQLLDVCSSTELPRRIQCMDLKSKKMKTLLEAEHPLAAYATGNLSVFTIPNGKGDSLYARMYLPVGFDANKKYPVIVYWYGGPHAQLITNSWNGGAGDYWFQYMAERGYLVFTIDTRGSSNRGKVFEQSIFRRAGEKQMDDLNAGVNYLKSLPYTDASNMGLFGWSYGGFMTINFMLTYPGVFQTAVAGGPVTDWNLYEIMYTERYMDRPQENPEGYAQTNLSKRIDQLKGKLLLIHGMQDNVVVMQHSVNLVKAAVDKGVQVDYMIYPGHEHNVLGKDRAHLYQKVTDYFQLHLKH